MSDSGKTYTIRVEGTANRFGLGEQILPGIHFFKHGHYGLSKEELDQAISLLGKATIR